MDPRHAIVRIDGSHRHVGIHRLELIQREGCGTPSSAQADVLAYQESFSPCEPEIFLGRPNE
jgi:hypothetical protein